MKKLLLVLSCLLLLNLRATAADGESPGIRLDFSNVPVTDVLVFYGKLTGQQVVYDNSVSGAVTVKTREPVSREQAEAMIEETLFLDGFSLLDNEDGSILKVIGLGKAARVFGVPVFTTIADLPKHERLVSLVISLRHANAQTAAGWMGAYSPPNATNAFTPVSLHTLIVTAPTSVVRCLVKVVEALDVPDILPSATRPLSNPRPEPPTP